jgi:hypothetical protein
MQIEGLGWRHRRGEWPGPWRGDRTGRVCLDTEDTAELVALKNAKKTLRQAIASAEKANGGRALSAGLEQVRGKAVWGILIQDGAVPNKSTSTRDSKLRMTKKFVAGLALPLADDVPKLVVSQFRSRLSLVRKDPL